MQNEHKEPFARRLCCADHSLCLTNSREYDQIGALTSQTQSSSASAGKLTSSFSTQSALDYGVSNVTIPVPCCPNIPASFVVGNYMFKASSEGPPCIYSSLNGIATTATCVRAAFNVTTREMIPPMSQIVNFTWAGTFGAHPPSPTNASVLNGSVRMNWMVNSSLLYLHITTRWPPILTNGQG
jgi:hypothetical protein